MSERMTKLQANKLRDKGETIEVFNHSTLGILNITEMRLTIEEAQQYRPDLFRPVEIPFANVLAEGEKKTGADVIDWLVNQREIDEERIAALTPEELDEPVINVFDMDHGGACYIVDGIHRLVGRFRRGDKTFKFYAWPLSMCPMIPRELAEAFDRPWGTKEVDPVKKVLRDINTGEET